MTVLFRHEHLIESTAQLFAAAGLDRPVAQTVAEILVEAELLGYDTHGLQFIPVYIKNIENGETKRQGKPGILRDGGNTLLLDALGLPGQWATVQALEIAQARLAEHRVVMIVVRNCANISCLAAYAKRAADLGLSPLLRLHHQPTVSSHLLAVNRAASPPIRWLLAFQLKRTRS